jgi:hypothetical protein
MPNYFTLNGRNGFFLKRIVERGGRESESYWSLNHWGKAIESLLLSGKIVPMSQIQRGGQKKDARPRKANRKESNFIGNPAGRGEKPGGGGGGAERKQV